MLESTLRDTLRKGLEAEGALVVPYPQDTRSIAGIPDIYVASPTWTGWIEAKVDTNPTSKIQRARMKQLWDHDAEAYVVRALRDEDAHRTVYVIESFDGVRICTAPKPGNGILRWLYLAATMLEEVGDRH